MRGTPPTPAAAPLRARERARGRRLAISSHPFGMTFQTVFTNPLPTLALLSLGASETLVGLQMAVVYASLLLQLPTLRMIARVPKRRILVAAHVTAVVGALPLLAFRELSAWGNGAALAISLAAFSAAAAGIGSCAVRIRSPRRKARPESRLLRR